MVLTGNFSINKMDVIKRGSFIPPHTTLPRSLQKFAELNVLSPSSRRNVWMYPNRLSTTTAKLSSSTDAPRKRRKPVPRQIKEPLLRHRDETEPLRTVITPKPSKDSTQVVTLENFSTKKAPEETPQSEKHRGHLVWEELQKLTEGDTGPPRWLSSRSATTQQENAPLFLCLPGLCF